MNWVFPIKFAGESRGWLVIPHVVVFLTINLAFWFLFALVVAWGAHVGWDFH